MASRPAALLARHCSTGCGNRCSACRTSLPVCAMPVPVGSDLFVLCSDHQPILAVRASPGGRRWPVFAGGVHRAPNRAWRVRVAAAPSQLRPIQRLDALGTRGQRGQEGPAQVPSYPRPDGSSPTRTRKLSRSRVRSLRTTARKLTQRDVDSWITRLVLDIAQAHEISRSSSNPELVGAVEELDRAALKVLKMLGAARGMPDLSDLVARAIARDRGGSSSLRVLELDLRNL